MDESIITGVATYVPISRPERLNIIRRVAMKLSEDSQRPGGRKPKVVELTGLMPNVIKQLSKKIPEIAVKVTEIDRSAVHKQLIQFYLEQGLMPSTYQLFINLEGKLPLYMDLGEFRKYLLKNGFMWKQIVTGTFVVIEKPQVIYERYCYLKSIQRYRKEGRAIYFIEESAFDSKGNFLTFKESKARSNERLIRVIYAVSDDGLQFKQYTDSFNAEVFKKWIKDTLIMSLSEPSIIVLNNYKHHCEEILKLPNANSTKREMCGWLDNFNVPYDSEMAKNMLYELVQKYTDFTQKLYTIDNMLKLHGHTVLRIPNCILKLTPATYYTEAMRINLPLSVKQDGSDHALIFDKLNTIIDTLNKDYTSAHTKNVITEETLILEQDDAVDDAIDHLESCMCIKTPENMDFDSDLPSDDSDSE